MQPAVFMFVMNIMTILASVWSVPGWGIKDDRFSMFGFWMPCDTVCDLNNGYGQARVKVHLNEAGAVQSVTTITTQIKNIFFS